VQALSRRSDGNPGPGLLTRQPQAVVGPALIRGEDVEDRFEGLEDEALLDEIRRVAGPHERLAYSRARRLIYNEVDNIDGLVHDVYLGRTWVPDGNVPDHNDLNVEHTWPKSKLPDSSAAVSDLHHLFPVDSDANNFRGNLPFGEVVTPNWQQGESSRGRDADGDTVFEPPPGHKGNVARALFYLASVYDLDLDAEQESVLKQWHALDPVDALELQRNDRIEQHQRNRNPFVDSPELVAHVSDF
jgi:deoxyribonuclease I